MSFETTTSRRGGLTMKEHRLTVPWDPFTTDAGDTFELFARELSLPGADGATASTDDRPALVYLQGGPGFPAPRPLDTSGWLGQALQDYRVILIDQRGTGRSHRIDSASAAEDRGVDKLKLLRQEYIVEDCEALREALGIDAWALIGQSFGGFCITAYLSHHPESVTHAYLTGGLPATTVGVDDVYRATYSKLAARHREFYAQFPWAEDRIREIAHHLDNADETLPTGERLSARRFRTIGIELGRGSGFAALAYLLEDPFRQVAGEKRLKTDFLAEVGDRVSFAHGPLYAAIHESIYGGVGGQDVTGWAAHRIRAEVEAFAEDADPRSADEYFLTGEHVYPWQFEEDPALHELADAANALAAHSWERSPYDPGVLATAPVAAAAAYYDDIFVPLELSLDTAGAYRDCRLHITNYFQHNGISVDGAGLFNILRDKIRDH